MPIGYDYRCDDCGHEWLLFSTRYSLGPIQWGETKFTCFTCQTFLSVAKSVDRNSWNHWLTNNANIIAQNRMMQKLADLINDRLDTTTGLTPVQLHFDSIECPTCETGELSTMPFGQQKMLCSKCERHTGTFINNNGITIYGPIETNGENDG